MLYDAARTRAFYAIDHVRIDNTHKDNFSSIVLQARIILPTGLLLTEIAKKLSHSERHSTKKGRLRTRILSTSHLIIRN